MHEPTSPQPRCTRITVTAVYADGTSVVADVPEPLEATMDLKHREGIPFDPAAITAVLSSHMEFTIRVKLATWAWQHAQVTVVRVPGADHA